MELSLLSDAKRRRATWKNNQGKLFILAGILAGILLFRLEDFDGKRRRAHLKYSYLMSGFHLLVRGDKGI